MESVRAQDVFKPNGTPDLTYVARKTDYEAELKRALKESGAIVSVNGPSKSGKTVLAERVIGKPNWVYVPCSQFRGGDEFWNEVMRQLGVPEEDSESFARGAAHSLEGGAAATLGVPLASVTADVKKTNLRDSVHTISRGLRVGGPTRAIEALTKSKRVLVVDDFHFLTRDLQIELGRQVKDAAFKGVPIVILSVPHRGDDPVRAVPDLRGRIQSINLTYWTKDELQQIPDRGFPLLNVQMERRSFEQLSAESFGSPQLMQRLCLDACYELGAEETLPRRGLMSIDASELSNICKRTARSTDFSTMTKTLEAGPTWGKERTQFQLVDGSAGDVYRCVLAAIAAPPPRLSLTSKELKARVAAVVERGEGPVGQAVERAVEYMTKAAEEASDKAVPPQEPVVQWEEEKGGVLDMPDPYFVFHLRWLEFPDLNAPVPPEVS